MSIEGIASSARAEALGAPLPGRAPDVQAHADAPDIAIIIPHHDDPERLATCLSALEREGLEGTETVVVDNASRRPPSPELIAAHPRVRFVAEAAPGAALARNRGVAETSAPNLLFIDADCVACPGWLSAARAAIGTAELVGGHVGVFDETPPPRSGAEAFETIFAFDFKTYIEKKGFSGSGNLLTTRAVFEEVGGFRTGLSEDLEWCRRATARGHRLIYRADMAVMHPSRPDWPSLSRKWRRLTDETFGLHCAARGRGVRARLAWAGRALLMPASVLAHLPRVLRAPALSGPGERFRAATTLIRLRLARMGWMLRQAARGG